VDDPEVRAVSLASLGSIALIRGDDAGYGQLEESLAIARAAGLTEAVDRALNNLGIGAAYRRELRRAESYFGDLAEHSERSEIVRCSIDEPRAEVALALGKWGVAEELARSGRGATDPVDPMLAEIILARLAVRRGDDPEPLLIGPEKLAAELDSPLVGWPLLTCRAERAWLTGELESLEEPLRTALAEARHQGDPWTIGEFSRWLWLLGDLAELDDRAALPYRLEIAGDIHGAAAEWERLEMPYERAVCLAGSEDLADLRLAHAILAGWGSTLLGSRVGERIRALGGQVPRGPRPSTRAHPGGLTKREAEIADFVAEGRSNREIAEALHLSTKTAAHHVSAILGKLGLERRSQVARALGHGRTAGSAGRVGGSRLGSLVNGAPRGVPDSPVGSGAG
jgi:DNA-binding CsgD family transcriptional regulator